MKDMIPSGDGNSRFLKSVAHFATLYPNYAAFVAALVAGTLPIDLNGINAEGCDQVGTPLNKANLLTDDTVDALGISAILTHQGRSYEEPTVNDALQAAATFRSGHIKLKTLFHDNTAVLTASDAGCCLVSSYYDSQGRENISARIEIPSALYPLGTEIEIVNLWINSETPCEIVIAPADNGVEIVNGSSQTEFSVTANTGTARLKLVSKSAGVYGGPDKWIIRGDID